MNPNKCAFRVSAREFLGFMVHERGIEVGQKNMKAIDEVVPPTNETQLLKLLPFSPLLKLKANQEFKWGDVQQKAFDEIKEYRKAPPVLVPPQLGKPFKLYVSADNHTIRLALMQEFEGNGTGHFLSE